MSEQSKIILPNHETESNTVLLIACMHWFCFFALCKYKLSHSAYSKMTVIAHIARVQLVFIYFCFSWIFDNSAFFFFIYTLLWTFLLDFDRVWQLLTTAFEMFVFEMLGSEILQSKVCGVWLYLANWQLLHGQHFL